MKRNYGKWSFVISVARLIGEIASELYHFIFDD